MSCRHDHTVKDYTTGEVVCVDCGLVVSEIDYAPPPQVRMDRKLRAYECTSYSAGTHLKAGGRWGRLSRLDSRKRTEAKITILIERICAWLNSPSHISAQAVYVARKLLRAMRRRESVRFSVDEAAAVSVLLAYRYSNIPLTAERLAETLNGNGYGNRLYNKDVILRLYRRASAVLATPRYWGYPKDFLGKITAKFLGMVDNRYLSLLEQVAFSILKETERSSSQLLAGRNPLVVAAASIIAADQLLGGHIGEENILRKAEVGDSATALASWLRTFAPPLPPEAVHYSITGFQNVRRRVVVGVASA